VEQALHVERRQGEVGQHEEGPDGVEEHEVQGVGRPAAKRADPCADACGGEDRGGLARWCLCKRCEGVHGTLEYQRRSGPAR
jgi:hypothetical protein